MEPPARVDSESLRDEKVKVLKAIPALKADDVVRGQFRGYREESGVARDSQVETFAAVRLHIDSWRWQGVPFYIRTGKCLPVTCTEVVVRLRLPPTVFPTAAPRSNYFRFRIMPRQTIAIGVTAMDEADRMIGQRAELVASRQPGADERAAYERVLSDALEGDADAVCADGLRRRGLAHRRSGVGGEHAGARTTNRGPGVPSVPLPLPADGRTRRQERERRRMRDADKRAPRQSAELKRLEAGREWDSPWRQWGPYLSERQWGTVREDYSPNGDAWEYFHSRSGAIARVSLGRGRARRLLRPEAATVFRPGAVERERPDSQGAPLRAEQCRGQPRRGREGVLLLSRFDADALVHEVAVQVPPGRLPVRRSRDDECAPHAR